MVPLFRAVVKIYISIEDKKHLNVVKTKNQFLTVPAVSLSIAKKTQVEISKKLKLVFSSTYSSPRILLFLFSF